MNHARGLNTDRIMSLLLQASSSATGVGVEQILGDQRNRHVVAARYRFIGEAYALGDSCAEIGRFLRRDHTTVLHALRRIGMTTRPAGRPIEEV